LVGKGGLPLVPLDVGISESRIRTAEDGVRVVLPVLYRPRRAAAVYSSCVLSVERTPVRPLFMLSYGDRKQLAAVKELDADYAVLFEGRRPGDYARKINTGAALTKEPWIFTGADDLFFHPGWADKAVEFANERNLRAVGVNDGGRWSTRHKVPPTAHFLVRRDYYLDRGTADEKPAIFHTGYDHTYCDTEFMWTAVARDEYGYCAAALVEHLHPVWRKGKRDEVYALGQAKSQQDHRLFRSRESLWKTSRS
jgi:hypothetical protein